MKWLLCLLMCLLLPIPAAGDDAATLPVWSYPVSQAVLENSDGYITLANKQQLLDSEYIPPDLVKLSVKRTSSSAIEMRALASEQLSLMFAQAKEDGIVLYAHSGYRSYRTQKTMYYNRLDSMGYDDGAVAYPGSSDHQTGLGVDVISKAWIGKRFNEKFAKTEEAMWMAEHCMEYGYVIRYPDQKTDVTEIMYEPWHLRFVGLEAAQYMSAQGLTLEEFTAEYEAYLAANPLGFAQTPQPTPTPAPTQVPVATEVVVGYGLDGDTDVNLFIK